ncbi:asparaginase, partial [Ameyamaea chiangmaiensis]
MAFQTDAPLAEVTRAGRVESVHRGAVAVVDDTGRVVFAAGDIEQPTYTRSSVKALLALPLVETGAADRLGLTAEELALACASHTGEAMHATVAARMLARTGRDVACLECGTHWPTSDAAARALAASGHTPSALHNNCSGKHAGFVCVACDSGRDVAGYSTPDHPVMREAVRAVAEMTGAVHDDSNRGIDGCSIPTHAIALRALATGFARFATGAGLH